MGTDDDTHPNFNTVMFDATLFLNIVMCSFVVVSYMKFKHLRRNAFQMVLNLAIADGGLAAAYLLRNNVFDGNEELKPGALCTTSGILQTYFELAGPLWTLVMSFALHRTVVQRKYGSWRNSFSRYMLFCWGLPVVISILPLVVLYPDPYLPPNKKDLLHVDWCWINKPPHHRNSPVVAVIQLVCYFLPLWVVIALNVLFSVLIRRHLRQALRRDGGHDSELATQLKRLVKRLQWYPYILMITTLPVSLIRWYPWLNGMNKDVVVEAFESSWFEAVLLVSIGSTGILHSLAYGMTNAVWQAWAQECRSLKHGSGSDRAPDPVSTMGPRARSGTTVSGINSNYMRRSSGSQSGLTSGNETQQGGSTSTMTGASELSDSMCSYQSPSAAGPARPSSSFGPTGPVLPCDEGFVKAVTVGSNGLGAAAEEGLIETRSLDEGSLSFGGAGSVIEFGDSFDPLHQSLDGCSSVRPAIPALLLDEFPVDIVRAERVDSLSQEWVNPNVSADGARDRRTLSRTSYIFFGRNFGGSETSVRSHGSSGAPRQPTAVSPAPRRPRGLSEPAMHISPGPAAISGVDGLAKPLLSDAALTEERTGDLAGD